MKPFGLIILCTVSLVGTDVQAMSSKPTELKNMMCHITTPDTKGCSGIPTLQSGLLTILKNKTFELKARYEGCFFIEDVTKSGKFHVSYFKKSMSFELLATEATGVKDTTTNFPRTLGFVNLNYAKLNGYFVDISAVIRGRGRETKNVITSKLQCEAYE